MGGFTDLHKTLTSQRLERALALSHGNLSEMETDTKFTSNLQDNRKNSKAVLLQKAVESIDFLSKYIIKHARNAELRKNKDIQSKNTNVEAGVPLNSDRPVRRR